MDKGVNDTIAIIGGADGPTAIFLAGKSGGDFFWIPAVLILLFFYGIYFTKMIIQKSHGIKTNQMGTRKEKSIHTVELFMSIATLLIVPAQLLSVVLGWSMLPNCVRIAGIVIALVGDVIFLIAVITMRDSWRAGIPGQDKTEMVTFGIYRISRNPAFLGFDLMYLGMLLLFFNPLLLVFTVWVMVMLHLQILQEEKFLAGAFGEPYQEYKKHTCRYLGRKKEKLEK